MLYYVIYGFQWISVASVQPSCCPASLTLQFTDVYSGFARDEFEAGYLGVSLIHSVDSLQFVNWLVFVWVL